MAKCGECFHAGVCKIAEACDGEVYGCKHFVADVKTYTLEELATKICDGFEECVEGECPGFAYCGSETGTLVWLRRLADQ